MRRPASLIVRMHRLAGSRRVRAEPTVDGMAKMSRVCGAEVYPLCDRDAGWECIRVDHVDARVPHVDLDGTQWPVGELGPVFLG